MTERETGFLLIGLGFGLMFAIATIVEVLLSLYRNALITEYRWDKIILLIPVMLLVIGGVLVLRRPKSNRTSN